MHEAAGAGDGLCGGSVLTWTFQPDLKSTWIIPCDIVIIILNDQVIIRILTHAPKIVQIYQGFLYYLLIPIIMS